MGAVFRVVFRTVHRLKSPTVQAVWVQYIGVRLSPLKSEQAGDMAEYLLTTNHRSSIHHDGSIYTNVRRKQGLFPTIIGFSSPLKTGRTGLAIRGG